MPTLSSSSRQVMELNVIVFAVFTVVGFPINSIAALFAIAFQITLWASVSRRPVAAQNVHFCCSKEISCPSIEVTSGNGEFTAIMKFWWFLFSCLQLVAQPLMTPCVMLIAAGLDQYDEHVCSTTLETTAFIRFLAQRGHAIYLVVGMVFLQTIVFDRCAVKLIYLYYNSDYLRVSQREPDEAETDAEDKTEEEPAKNRVELALAPAVVIEEVQSQPLGLPAKHRVAVVEPAKEAVSKAENPVKSSMSIAPAMTILSNSTSTSSSALSLPAAPPSSSPSSSSSTTTTTLITTTTVTVEPDYSFQKPTNYSTGDGSARLTRL